MSDEHQAAKPAPVLQIAMLSHGTLECRDLEKTREFYEHFLGLEVVRTSNTSMWIRLNSNFAIACVQTGEKKASMPLLNHNGLDVATRDEVDRAYVTIVDQRATWGIGRVTKPVDQHGTYSFYFCDLDENWWEILTNPPGGYSWMFRGQRDVSDWGAGEADNTNPNSFTKRRSSTP
jgi:catechol 2,3-dioxygenase-like lactoylglutathione lyase family enzyme